MDKNKNNIILNYKINKLVTLSSGKDSNYYYDIKSLLLDNYAWNKIKNNLIKDLKEKFPGISYVAGYGVGGMLLAMRIASCSEDLEALILRKNTKSYGLLKQIEGNFDYTDCRYRVVVVDDVVTTGKSFKEAINILSINEINILGSYVLLKRKENIFKCESFITI